MKVLGTGSYLPDYILTNDQLALSIDTSDQWITSRTGIKERRISQDEEDSDLATKAAEKAIQNSQIEKDNIELILVATLSSEYSTPSIACIVQKNLNIENAICMDINAACSGFIYALQTADCYMKAGIVQNALIIGTETLSKLVDYSDRSTCILFGDGAGALVVQSESKKQFYCKLGANGLKSNALVCNRKKLSNLLVKKEQPDEFIHMNGQEIYKFVLRIVPQLIEDVVREAGLRLDEVKYYVLHQANQRMNQIVAEKLGVADEFFPSNLKNTGNTSAASVPILLDELNREHKLKSSDKLVCCAFGGGLTWGAALLEW